jgi:molybdopterin/thiamine biosynthesis adenylyltransferase
MHLVTREPSADRDISESDLLHGRWSRTRSALGDAVWQRVRSSTVAMIGCGRNGSAAAMILTMLGVAGIVLIDSDREELHNLDATLGADPEGIGDLKVANRSAALRRLRPDDLEVTAIGASLLDPGVAERLRRVDLIVTCVDEDAPRLAAAMIANRLGKVHLDIGTGVLVDRDGRHVGGDIRLLLPGDACVQCLGGLADPERARYEVAAPPGALRRGPRQAWFQQRAGSLITINLVAVNAAIQLWLDLLAGRVTESRWCRLEWSQRGEVQVRQTQPTSDECSLCRQRALERAT